MVSMNVQELKADPDLDNREEMLELLSAIRLAEENEESLEEDQREKLAERFVKKRKDKLNL